jgi:large subunit ribosomal protein L3
MVTGIIGKKVGMTQVFAPDGTAIPGTVIKAGPCVVVQAKTKATEGYEAVQLGLVEERPARARKPLAGHYKKAGVPPTRVRREVQLAAGSEGLKAGDQVLVNGVFSDGDRVDVIGISRGKGFQGVMKRHNFRGGAATHGSMFHRAPGSIGASSFPSRVVKGRTDGRRSGDHAQPQSGADRRREQHPRAARRCAGRARRLRGDPESDRAQAGAEAAGREAVEGGKRQEVALGFFESEEADS